MVIYVSSKNPGKLGIIQLIIIIHAHNELIHVIQLNIHEFQMTILNVNIPLSVRSPEVPCKDISMLRGFYTL